MDSQGQGTSTHRKVGLRLIRLSLTFDELDALTSALEAVEMPIVSDLNVYTRAVAKLNSAYHKVGGDARGS